MCVESQKTSRGCREVGNDDVYKSYRCHNKRNDNSPKGYESPKTLAV